MFIPMANAIVDDETGQQLEYRHLIKMEKYRKIWSLSFAKELDRLAQGKANHAQGTNTIFFIDKNEIPNERKGDVTYGRIVVDYRPQKLDPHINLKRKEKILIPQTLIRLTFQFIRN